MALNVQWRKIAPEDHDVRGPQGAFTLRPDAVFTWGRRWRPSGSTVRHAEMSSAISSEAIVVRCLRAPQTGAFVAEVRTRQGGERSDGYLDVLNEDGRLHRLSERGSSAARLPAGIYTLRLSVLEPVCELALVVPLTADRPPPRAGDPAGEVVNVTQPVWSLDEMLTPGTTMPTYAVSLLALAAVDYDDLRGGATPSACFKTLLREVLGKDYEWGSRQLAAAATSYGLAIPEGSQRLAVVATFRRDHTSAQQRRQLREFVSARLVG